ncbi:MAG: protein translocase subunit SecD, partial [Actinomycetia bacterium]|nr:protein translocase subunit SecD [Actinomycetes bacterium]
MSSPRSTAAIWRAILAFAIVAVSVYVAATSPPKLGLDLAGGTQLVYETQSTEKVEANAESTDRALAVLRGRVDALGVSEPTLTRSGEKRIIIELPGEQASAKAEDVIGTTAQLTFHAVTGTATQQQLQQFEKTGEVDGAGTGTGTGDDGSNIPGQKLPDDQQSGNTAENSSTSSADAGNTAQNVSTSSA